MKSTICGSLALAGLLSGALPARADDVATVREKLKAASAAVKSVVIDMVMSPPGAGMPNAPRGIHIRITAVGPATMKSVAQFGPVAIESYEVDGMLYVHMEPGDSWRKMSFDPSHPPAQVLDMLRAGKNEQFLVLPDSFEDGVPVGVVQIEMQLPAPAGTASVGPPLTLTCSYDKTTYHMRSCANQSTSVTFTKYDDPTNTVVLPPAAAGAVLIVTKTPAPDVPAPSPGPSSTPLPGPSSTPSPSATFLPSPSPSPSPSPVR